MLDLSRVRVLGRCVEDGGCLWMTFPLSEVGFRVSHASFLRLRLRGDDTVSDPAKEGILARFAVYLNGRKTADMRMKSRRSSVVVFEGKAWEQAEVRLVKLSECTQSLMALEAIETDGLLEPLPENPLRIEFIGDSITCGYGVEAAGAEETFTTATENAEKSYAGLTAKALSADAVLTACSGFGIVSGYTGDPDARNETELLPPYYEKAGCNDYRLPSGKRLQDIPWDFAAWQPQYIIIHLGTNDLSWCGSAPERAEAFRQGYVQFLKTVRYRNPGARILCMLGIMGEGLNESVQQAADAYRKATGDGNLRVMLFREQNLEQDGAGADFHPSAITQERLAQDVTEAVRAWSLEKVPEEPGTGLSPEDYMDPSCMLCGKPGETETVHPVPIGRILDKLSEYERRNDTEGAGRHLRYWLAEAELNRDERGQLTLNNELMGYYRMRGDGILARKHASQAVALVDRLGLEDTITAGTTYINAGTVQEAFGDPESGLRYFDRARENYEKNLPEQDARLGGLYNNMGLALMATGRHAEAETLFHKAMRVMKAQPGGKLEQAITWLNLADNAEARMGTEEAEKTVESCLEHAAALLEEPDIPENAYYAFVLEKCAPVFAHYGYFLKEAELRGKAKAIRDRLK